MFFKKKKVDTNINEAIDFIKKQNSINAENIKKLKELGFSTSQLEYWDKLYNDIISMLKTLKNN